MEIKEISHILQDEKSLAGFYKTEKLASESNFYCLWPTPEYFYLYHTPKEEFALKSNSILTAKRFNKIEDYSEKTGSFIAYRKENDYVHIIFEDGYIESTNFCYVGTEKNGIRAVKTCSERWFFYDTTKRKFLDLTGTNGYLLDGSLDTILTSNVFTINMGNNSKRLISYTKGKAPVYSRDYFDLIELVNKSTFIGKLYNRNIFCIIKNNNIAYPIGYYTSLPKYVKEHNLFIASKGESYCIVKDNKDIQNYQWKSDAFIFQNNYVFNKQENTPYWKIFNINDGHEIPTNFKNIQILDDQGAFLSVESNGIQNQRISIEDIERISQVYIRNLLEERTIKEKVTKIEENTIDQSKRTSNNIEKCPTCEEDNKICNEVKPMEKNVDSNNIKIPSSLNYYIFAPVVSIIDNRLTSGNINCEMFRGATYIIWLVLDKHRLIVTESRRTKVHNILYTKKDSPLVEKLYKGKHFWKYRQLYPINCVLNQLNVVVLEEELSQLFAKIQHSEIETERIQLSTKPIKKQEQPQEPKEKNLTLVKQAISTKNLEATKFRFDHTSYQIKLDEVWDIDDIFQRKRVQYRQAEDIIAILYDFTTDCAIKSPDGHVHYHIYGEGKDKRFDQYFGQNSNTLLRASIHSENKRILLFKRNAKKKILFQDEVKCIGYYKTLEENNIRSVIYFKLESILRYRFTDATNINEPKKEEIKIETKEITNKEEVNKPSNLINMSKLQEFYEVREKLQNLGIIPNADFEKQLAALEEENIKNEIVPMLTKSIEPVLKLVKREITLIVEYSPEDGVCVNLSPKNQDTAST